MAKAAAKPEVRAWVVEVSPRPGAPDPAGDAARADLASAGIAVASVATSSVYLVAGLLAEADVARLSRELFSDPVLEEARHGPYPGPLAEWPEGTVLVAKRPGVMDPVEASVRRGIADLGLSATAVRTARRYRIAGMGDRAALRAAVERVLANPVVEEILIGTVPPAPGAPTKPEPPPDLPPAASVPLRDLDGPALVALSRRMALALSEPEMAAVRDFFRAAHRDPTDVELETLAQTWSEHCKHKTLTAEVRYDGRTFKNLLQETIFAATAELARPYCLSVFRDNAGVVRLDDEWAVAVKVETHNHPSAIEPTGGAGTGSGGVIRDVLGTGRGARPILCTDTFGVAPPDHAGALPPGVLHPRRVLRGVVAGVRDYGNRMGIPTAAGGLLVHPGYLGSPLVFAGCVGVLPASAVAKEVRPGDRIVLAGGRTGRDGIHGATFSSEALSADSERISATAVQIGNAIEEKRLVEGVLRVRDLGALRAITDCGAGGLSSAVGEMGEGTGAEVELSLVPLKYEGLSPAEVWVSEAQERMVLAVPPERLEDALRALADEEVEATAIGRFTSDRRLRVLWRGKPVADLPMEFLHQGLPRTPREARWTPPPAAEPKTGPPPAPGAEILAMLSDWTVCSREWIVRQYDHEVQGGTVGKPFVGARAEGPSDGCVVRPDPRSFRGVAIAHGANPRYGELDPHAMAVSAVDEALRNLVAMGADLGTVALLDNFVWGDTDDPEVLGGLVRACLGCRDAALAYGAPFVSGKDSLHNVYVAPDGRRLPVPGTLLVTALAVVPDVRRLVTSDLKRPGDALYLVGVTRDELGGSLFHARRGARGANVPRPEPERARRVLAAVTAATGRGVVRAAHDPSEGGLGVALAEMCLGGDLGASVSIEALPRVAADTAWSPTDGALLFSESPSRVLCEVAPGDAAAFERCCQAAGAPVARIGDVSADPRLVLRGRGGATVADVTVAEIRRAFREPLYRVMGEKSP